MIKWFVLHSMILLLLSLSLLEAKRWLFEALNMNDTSILNKSLNYYVIETCPFYPQFFLSSSGGFQNFKLFGIFSPSLLISTRCFYLFDIWNSLLFLWFPPFSQLSEVTIRFNFSYDGNEFWMPNPFWFQLFLLSRILNLTEGSQLFSFTELIEKYPFFPAMKLS